MDLELKEFEEKINNITEQFMSLLNSTESIENSVGNKFEEAPIKFEESVGGGPTVFHTGIGNYNNISTTPGIGNSYENVTGTTIGGGTFKLGAEDINFGGIAYGSHSSSKIPKHAVKFDSAEQMDLNRRLENLYDIKKESTTNTCINSNPSIAFSDSNLRKARNMSMGYTEDNTYTNNNNGYSTYNYNTNSNYTNDKTSSTLKDKEVYEMANYNGEGNNNVFYNFATVPADKALVEKKSWKDVLFMDIPWDTKIDIWGEFKKFCTAQIKITF